MPRCAWILLASLAALLHHTIGLAATVGFLLSAAAWVLATPAALVMVAALAAHHLLTYHAPRPARTHS